LGRRDREIVLKDKCYGEESRRELEKGSEWHESKRTGRNSMKTSPRKLTVAVASKDDLAQRGFEKGREEGAST